jgi:hypothetical protein
MTTWMFPLTVCGSLILGSLAVPSPASPAPPAGQTTASLTTRASDSSNALALSNPAITSQVDQPSDQKLDATQAVLMLDLLEGVAEGRHEPEKLDAVMSSEGTELIVGQLNLARRASTAQYRQLLLGLMEGVRPEIEPVDSTRRAEMGVVGLLDGCWPRLVWGLERTDVLRERVDHLQALDFYDQARATANHFLPEPLQVSPRVFAVIGSRAGGAKIGADRLYLDVLAYSYRNREDETFPTDNELIGTAAHEMHHMGYGHYLSRMGNSLSLTDSERLMFEFVSAILSEGSATYLISADRDLGRLQERRSYAQYLDRGGELLSTSEDILRALVDGEISTPVEYEAAAADLLGNWFHSTGSLMLSIIDENGGLDRVMMVVADPRLLIEEYNKAAARLDSDAAPFIFDARIAGSLAQVGSAPPS